MNPSAPSSPMPPRRRGLPWFPIVTLTLGAAGIGWLLTQTELERNFQIWLLTLIPVLVVLLNLGWFFISPRFTRNTRLAGFVALLVLATAARLNLRVDGTTDGRGLPRIAWRWSESTPRIPPASTTPPPALPTAATANLLSLAADSPQFLGPARTGVHTDPGLSTNWNTQPPRELWRRPVGLGWSAFAVVKDRAITQEQRGNDEVVACYDLLTGTPVWDHSDTTRFSEWQGGDGPRATPTVQDGRVYTFGATGLLNCLDALSGKPLWRRSVLSEHNLGTNDWACSASPLLSDTLVIVTGGRGPGPVLIAYDRRTGEPAWKAGNDSASYASPILATLAGRRVVLSSNARSLIAVTPSTGQVLLEHEWGSGKWPKASQPVVLGDDRIFVSAGYGMGCQMIRVRANADGSLASEVQWKGVSMKTQFNSVAALDGHLYGLDDGLLACVNADTGKRAWKDGRFGSGQSLLAGNLLLVQNERGSVHLCTATSDAFHELGSIPALSSKTWNHPTLAGRFLLVRNDREAACYELPGK